MSEQKMISGKRVLFTLIGTGFLALQFGCIPMPAPVPRTRGTWFGAAKPARHVDVSGNTYPGWALEITSGPELRNFERPSDSPNAPILTDEDGILLRHHRLLVPGAKLKVSGTLRFPYTVRASPSGPEVAVGPSTSRPVPQQYVLTVDSIKPQ